MKKTLLESAAAGVITESVKKIASAEGMTPQELNRLIAAGRAVVPVNRIKKLTQPCAIGEGLSVKVNANLGTSPAKYDNRLELNKLKAAVDFGADTVMDLSIGPGLKKTREIILNNSPIPIGTVPIYEAATRAEKKHGSFLKMTAADLIQVITEQAREGVDFFTLHCGVTRKSLRVMETHPRLMGIVSRGGAIMANWIRTNKTENPLFTEFAQILEIMKTYDVTLSLGDGLRPGALADATDRAQLAELRLLGKLAEQARRSGVQVMIEGPGHVPLNQIAKNVQLQKKYCANAPFYVLGPLVCDSGAGYDHITAAIGAGVAAAAGADYLCFVTPSEHLSLPDLEDIKQGVIASRIAARAGDIARGRSRSWELERRFSQARKDRDWESQLSLSLDPKLFTEYRNRTGKPAGTKDVCSMCDKFCSIKLMDNLEDTA